MASARDLKGENYNVIAVIGDGSISSGMAFEALNNVGASGIQQLIVILKITNVFPTVGAIAKIEKALTPLHQPNKRENASDSALKANRLYHR
jgi:1-deoxy-D-xylulose-5-phosphate synthase